MARSITAGGFARSDRTIMLAAIVLAAIAAVLVFMAANSGSDDNTSNTPVENVAGGVSVVTAIDDIPANTTITESMVAVKSLPAAAILAQAYTAPESLVGKSTRYPLLKGEQITPNKIGESVKDDNSAALLVRPGNRAIGVPVTEDSMIGGLLLPGDFVDVIAVFDDTDTGKRKSVTLIQNAEVIAVGQDAQDPIPASASGETTDGGTYGQVPDGQDPNPNATTVTLSVPPDQAQLLALTANDATLWLALRSRGDTAPLELPESNLDPYQTINTDAPTEG